MDPSDVEFMSVVESVTLLPSTLALAIMLLFATLIPVRLAVVIDEFMTVDAFRYPSTIVAFMRVELSMLVVVFVVLESRIIDE